jgi:hypothetical protein
MDVTVHRLIADWLQNRCQVKKPVNFASWLGLRATRMGARNSQSSSLESLPNLSVSRKKPESNSGFIIGITKLHG